jgi:hypothetical protein
MAVGDALAWHYAGRFDGCDLSLRSAGAPAAALLAPPIVAVDAERRRPQARCLTAVAAGDMPAERL